jgi:hypothetical protein
LPARLKEIAPFFQGPIPSHVSLAIEHPFSPGSEIRSRAPYFNRVGEMMSSRQWFRWSVGSLAVAGIAWGCQDASRVTAPRLSPGKLAYDASVPPALQGGQLIVCKDTPPGTSGRFQIDAYFQDGSDRSVGIDINSGECQVIVTSSPDPTIAVLENLGNGDPGWHLVSVTRITDAGTEELPRTGSGWDNVVYCTIDYLHGCILIFHNEQDNPPPPPPPGKTFTIGPSSMEGHLKIAAGTWFNGGYSFKFISNTHLATQFTVNAKVEVTVSCPYGGGPGGTILIPLGTVTYNVPAGNTNWLPTGDANSILSWMGAVKTPDLCGGFPMDNAKGAVFTATVSQNPASGSLVDFRFKYRNPAAKGKVDTNCTDANEPKRNDAATCGASWSQTVRDP